MKRAVFCLAAALAGCGASTPRIEVQSRVICAPVKTYSAETQARARAEMAATCGAAPTLCMMMGDYLGQRDAERACARGVPKGAAQDAWTATLAGMAKRGR